MIAKASTNHSPANMAERNEKSSPFSNVVPFAKIVETTKRGIIVFRLLLGSVSANQIFQIVLRVNQAPRAYFDRNHL